jgi:hypothetical protein
MPKVHKTSHPGIRTDDIPFRHTYTYVATEPRRNGLALFICYFSFKFKGKNMWSVFYVEVQKTTFGIFQI